LNEADKKEIDSLISWEEWLPLPGPQTQAFESVADVIGYGGAAGGGKTDLAIGMSMTKHVKSAFFRREGPQLQGIIDRFEEIVGNRDGYNGQKNIWRYNDRQFEFGSCPHAGDEKKQQGRPKDFLVLDEAANFLESQVRFLMGWVRTTKKNQKCTVLMTFNPPTDNDGEWVVSFFAPWLDPLHENPAKPGELRYFAVIDGEDKEVESADRFEHDGDLIIPQSRTFIPSKVMDNPFLVETGYIATLQALPEPLRSQMLKGDFMAGKADNPWQVCPTEWVQAAMDRWVPEGKLSPMDSMGVDVARGGKDETVIARRHGAWFDVNDCHPGSDTPNGQIVAGLTLAKRKDSAVVHMDVVGVGASPYDIMKGNDIHIVGIQSAAKAEDSHGKTLWDKSKQISFINYRSYMWWYLRECLDPETGENMSLPPDPKLKADLCAVRWKYSARGIQVESKEDIASHKRLGRSTNDGDAIVYANMRTPKKQLGQQYAYKPKAMPVMGIGSRRR
jgi:hypothetical protein